MTLAHYEDFLYGACLLDWDALAQTMRSRAARFEHAEEVRIIGDATDVRFSLKDRVCYVEDGHVNMPGGEFFSALIEDSAEGINTYGEYPALALGAQIENVRFEFRNGSVVEASATSNEEFLFKMLDSDAGARRLGEFGVGCNPGIRTFTRDILYDEKLKARSISHLARVTQTLVAKMSAGCTGIW